MGTFSIPISVGGPTGRSVDIEALVDTGATHSLLPGNVLVELGVEPIERVMFQLADESTVDYDIGEARLRLDGRERTALVIFGPEGATPLLGATTLELFNLAVDPVGRRLLSVPGLLKSVGNLRPITTRTKRSSTKHGQHSQAR